MCSSFQKRFHMPTLVEGSSWVCGLCGSTAEELASPLHPPLDGPVVIRTHVLEAHRVTLEQMESSTQIEATWTLADGRVWVRSAPGRRLGGRLTTHSGKARRMDESHP